VPVKKMKVSMPLTKIERNICLDVMKKQTSSITKRAAVDITDIFFIRAKSSSIKKYGFLL
jgi:hypothetical protein